MTRKTMRQVGGAGGCLLECCVCRYRFYAEEKNGHIKHSSWKCPNGCKVDGDGE